MNAAGQGFFTFIHDGGSSGGFGLFSGVHMAVLAVLAILIAGMCVVYIRLRPYDKQDMLKLTALAIFVLELLKQLSFPFIQSRYWLDQLPLHLCGLSIFIGLFHAYLPHKTTEEILYSLCLPGALAALLFPDWTMYPLFNFYCLQSFIIHALIIAFIVMQLLSGELVPSFKNLWRPALFLLVAVPPIYLLNLNLGTNFFFVNAGSKGSPLEIFVNAFGNPGFLLPYAGLLAGVWLVMYLPWAVLGRKSAYKKVRIYTRNP